MAVSHEGRYVADPSVRELVRYAKPHNIEMVSRIDVVLARPRLRCTPHPGGVGGRSPASVAQHPTNEADPGPACPCTRMLCTGFR